MVTAKGSLSFHDWVSAAQENCSRQRPSSIFFYGPGRLGSHLGASDILCINFEAVALIVNCDNSHNDTSTRRTNALDNLKLPSEISTESPISITALMSLSGAGAVVCHLWGGSFSAHQQFAREFWNNFTKKKLTNATALAAASGDSPSGHRLKRWVKLSRISFGLTNVVYSDA